MRKLTDSLASLLFSVQRRSGEGALRRVCPVRAWSEREG